MRRNHAGFSLIELLIVVAIIMLISAIAVPNLLRARTAANQASAIESLRLIDSSEVAYQSAYGIGYSANLLQLGPPPSGSLTGPSGAGLIDGVLAGAMKGGYTFPYVPGIPDANGAYQGFQLNANPVTTGQTGTAYYYTDHSLVIRGNLTGPASATDSPVAQ